VTPGFLVVSASHEGEAHHHMDVPQVRLTICTLHGSAPAMLERRGHRTLIVKNAVALRLHVTEWMVCNLTPEEAQVVTDGFGLTFPLPNWTTSLRPTTLYVPPALRLPGASVFQGGDELKRRQARGMLRLEQAALEIERTGRRIDLQTVADLTSA
jgi:hypothetical protein